MSHFNVSFNVWAKSHDSVHKPQFLKRKESRIGLNRSPSAYRRGTDEAFIGQVKAALKALATGKGIPEKTNQGGRGIAVSLGRQVALKKENAEEKPGHTALVIKGWQAV